MHHRQYACDQAIQCVVSLWQSDSYRKSYRCQCIAAGRADHHLVDLLQQTVCDYLCAVRSCLRKEDGELVGIDVYFYIIGAQAPL